MAGLKGVGALSVLLGLGIATASFMANPGARGIQDWRIFLVPAAFFLIVGFGTIALRPSAVLTLAIVSAAAGLALVVGGLRYVAFPESVLSIGFGLAACAPIYLAAHHWKALRVATVLDTPPRSLLKWRRSRRGP